KDTHEEMKSEAAQLIHTVKVLARGRFAIRIPYPRTDCVYHLAWKPLSESELEVGRHYIGFTGVAEAKPVELLKRFLDALVETPLSSSVTVALYGPLKSKTRWERLGAISFEEGQIRGETSDPPRDFAVGERSALGQAWCGVTAIFSQRPDDD